MADKNGQSFSVEDILSDVRKMSGNYSDENSGEQKSGKWYIEKADSLLSDGVYSPDSAFSDDKNEELVYSNDTSYRVTQEKEQEPLFYEPEESESYSLLKKRINESETKIEQTKTFSVKETPDSPEASSEKTVYQPEEKLSGSVSNTEKSAFDIPMPELPPEIIKRNLQSVVGGKAHGAPETIQRKRTQKELDSFIGELESVGGADVSEKTSKVKEENVNSFLRELSRQGGGEVSVSANIREQSDTKVVTLNTNEGKADFADEKTRQVGIGDSAKAISDLSDMSKTRVPVSDNTKGNEKNDTGDEPLKAESNSIDGQIKFPGFEEEEAVEKVKEDDVERELAKRRREATNNFRLMEIANAVGEPAEPEVNPMEYPDFQGDGSERDDGYIVPSKDNSEYTDPAHKIDVAQYFTNLKSRAVFKTIGLAVLTLTLFLIMLIPSLSTDRNFGEADAFASIIVLVLAGAISFKTVSSGFKALVSRNPNSNTAASLCLAATLLQSLTVTIAGRQDNIALLSFSASAVLLMYSVSDLIEYSRTEANFKFAAFDYADSLYSVTDIENPREAFEMSRGISAVPLRILYSSKLLFPTEFAKRSANKGVADRMCSLTVLFSAAAALLLSIIVGIAQKSFFASLSALAAVFCIAAPIGLINVINISLGKSNKKLRDIGGMITDIDSARRCAEAGAVAVDSGEIFSRSGSKIYRMKDFETVRFDDALLYAAAMIIKSGGPLADAFEDIIGGKHEMLPPVKSLLYEGRQGLTAFINGQKVFLGNRTLLHNHNIELPSQETEIRYINENKSVMYLAVEQKTAVMFIVEYETEEDIREDICSVADNGMKILVNTADANITDNMLSHSFSVQKGFMRVMNAVAGNVFNHRRNGEKDEEPSGILHDGEIVSMMKCIKESISLSKLSKQATLVQMALMVLLLVTSAVLIFVFDASWKFTLILTAVQIVLSLVLMVYSMIKK